MNLNILYLVGMFAVNLGLFWTLIAAASAFRRRRWLACFFQAACAGKLAVQIAAVYAVVPALWWPGGAEAFTDGVFDSLGLVLFSLVVHGIATLRDSKKKPLPGGSGS